MHMAASLLLVLSLESESAALIAQRQDELTTMLLALLEWRKPLRWTTLSSHC